MDKAKSLHIYHLVTFIIQKAVKKSSTSLFSYAYSRLRSGGFEERDTVYYNPNNPSESIMYASWSNLTIVGFIIIIVVSAILISINKVIKKIAKGKDNITMKVYKTK